VLYEELVLQAFFVLCFSDAASKTIILVAFLHGQLRHLRDRLAAAIAITLSVFHHAFIFVDSIRRAARRRNEEFPAIIMVDYGRAARMA
jgi:hypothetical protein